MPTKEQLSQEINEKLQTDLDWSKMTKDDLMALDMLIESGALIESNAKHIASEQGQEVLDKKIKEWEPGDIVARLLL